MFAVAWTFALQPPCNSSLTRNGNPGKNSHFHNNPLRNLSTHPSQLHFSVSAETRAHLYFSVEEAYVINTAFPPAKS